MSSLTRRPPTHHFVVGSPRTLYVFSPSVFFFLSEIFELDFGLWTAALSNLFHARSFSLQPASHAHAYLFALQQQLFSLSQQSVSLIFFLFSISALLTEGGIKYSSSKRRKTAGLTSFNSCCHHLHISSTLWKDTELSIFFTSVRFCVHFCPYCTCSSVSFRTLSMCVCRCVKSECIIQGLERSRSISPPPQVLPTVSELQPPAVSYRNHRDHITAQILNHTGGGSEKPNAHSVNSQPLQTLKFFCLSATVCSFPKAK